MTVRSRVSIALGLVPVLVVVTAVPAVASKMYGSPIAM